jgi:hypothetical protein
VTIKTRTEIPCPDCGAAVGERCKGLAQNRCHAGRVLRFSKRPCGCVVYRHDGVVSIPCFGFGCGRWGERHPDMKWNPETKAFAFPQEVL